MAKKAVAHQLADEPTQEEMDSQASELAAATPLPAFTLGSPKKGHPSVGAAIIQLMRDVPYVQRSKSQGLNYTFLAESELIAKIHPALIKNGLLMRPVSVTVGHCENYPSSSGKLMNRVMLIVEYEILHPESGTSVRVMAAGEGTDIGDKATPKAMTQAMKYALRQCLAIETGDDPDRQPSEEQARPANHEGYMKCMDAFKRAATRVQLLTLRDIYMNRRPDFSAEQRGELENAFWSRWPHSAGSEPAPPRNSQPPVQPRASQATPTDEQG